MMKMMMDGQQSFRNIKKNLKIITKSFYLFWFLKVEKITFSKNEQIFFIIFGESEIITRFEDVLESRDTFFCNQIKRWKMQ